MIDWSRMPEREGMDGSWELFVASMGMGLLRMPGCPLPLYAMTEGSKSLRSDGYQLFDRHNRRNWDGSRIG